MSKFSPFEVVTLNSRIWEDWGHEDNSGLRELKGDLIVLQEFTHGKFTQYRVKSVATGHTNHVWGGYLQKADLRTNEEKVITKVRELWIKQDYYKKYVDKRIEM